MHHYGLLALLMGLATVLRGTKVLADPVCTITSTALWIHLFFMHRFDYTDHFIDKPGTHLTSAFRKVSQFSYNNGGYFSFVTPDDSKTDKSAKKVILNIIDKGEGCMYFKEAIMYLYITNSDFLGMVTNPCISVGFLHVFFSFLLMVPLFSDYDDKFHVGKEVVFRLFSVIITQKYSPLQDNINIILSRLVAGGFPEKFLYDPLPQQALLFGTRTKQDNNEDPLTMEHFLTPIFFWALGLTMAAFVFVVEKIIRSF